MDNVLHIICSIILLSVSLIFIACSMNNKKKYINKYPKGLTEETIRAPYSIDGNCYDLHVFHYETGIPGPCVGMIGGVHGNEPSGTVGLSQFIRDLTQSDSLDTPIVKRGSMVIVPAVNQCGLFLNTRHQPYVMVDHEDINRNFTEEGGIDVKSRAILSVLSHCDFILDFHEAWGYYYDNQGSIGSTLSPTTEYAATISGKAVSKINKSLPESEQPRKLYQVRRGESCDVTSSLQCHMFNNGRHYILTETSGQEDIQPIELRAAHVRDVIDVTLDELMMI